jgi:hypothetical protein
MLKRERETARNTEGHLALAPIVMNRQFPASVVVRNTMQAALSASQNVAVRGFRLSQIEQKKRINVFWREMEWERNQRMKQTKWIRP